MSPLATWQGPYDAIDARMQTIHIGDEREVTDRDLESAHWQSASAPATPTFTPPVASSSASASTPNGEAD